MPKTVYVAEDGVIINCIVIDDDASASDYGAFEAPEGETVGIGYVYDPTTGRYIEPFENVVEVVSQYDPTLDANIQQALDSL